MTTLWMLAAFALSADPPGKTVFTYTDEDGTECFTDDLSTVPSALRAPVRETRGEPISVIKPQRPFPLPGVSEDDWAAEIPESRDGLARVRTPQDHLAKGEAELSARFTAYVPCQRFLDTCYSPRLTMETWRCVHGP